jgi:hypothetical protein
MVAKPLRNDHCAQVDGGSSQSQTTPSANAALQQPQTSPPAAPVQTVPDIPSQATSSAWLVHAIASVGMVMNSDAEKSQLEHIQTPPVQAQSRVPLSHRPHLRAGQFVPSVGQGMLREMPWHSTGLALPPTPTPPLPEPALPPVVVPLPPLPPVVVPLPPVPPVVVPVPPVVVPVPPLLCGESSALEQPGRRARSPTVQVIPIVRLIMMTSYLLLF